MLFRRTTRYLINFIKKREKQLVFIKNILAKFQSSKMLKNITKISSGTMLGQMVSFVTLPIFTRIYGAEVIGNWTLFNSVATIVNTFSDLGLSNAIMVEADEKESEKLFSVISTFVLFFSIIVAIGFGIYYNVFPSTSGINPLFYAVVLGILIFTQQQTQLSYSWLNKKSQYDVLMKNPIVNNISIAIVAIPLGFMGFTKYGYYLGLISGQIITLIHMRRFIPKLFFDLNIKNHIHVIKKYNEYIKYQMPTYMLAQVKNQAPVILIRSFFGSKILGYYSVSQRILAIPINLLANAIGKVYYQTVADMAQKKENVGEFTFKNIKRAMRLAIIPMIGIMAFGDIFCIIFFGADYYIAGNIIRIVSFMTFFTFLMLATQGITIVLHKQQYALYSAFVQIVGYFGALSLGKYVFNSVYFACAFMTIVFCLVQVVYFCFIFKSASVNPIRYIKELILNLAVIIGSVVVIRIILLYFGFTSGF